MGLFSIILVGGLLVTVVAVGVAIPFMMKEYGKDHDDMIE